MRSLYTVLACLVFLTIFYLSPSLLTATTYINAIGIDSSTGVEKPVWPSGVARVYDLEVDAEGTDYFVASCMDRDSYFFWAYNGIYAGVDGGTAVQALSYAPGTVISAIGIKWNSAVASTTNTMTVSLMARDDSTTATTFSTVQSETFGHTSATTTLDVMTLTGGYSILDDRSYIIKVVHTGGATSYDTLYSVFTTTTKRRY